MTGAIDLTGLAVLVVEDEYMIASDLAQELEAGGAEVVGPTANTTDALRAIESKAIDAAIVDLNLEGDMAYGVADALERRNIPFVFSTGYDASVIPARFAHIIRCEKPALPADVVSALVRRLAPVEPRP